MTIREQFQLVHFDIVQNIDNRFVPYLDTNVSVKFKGDYLQPHENLLLSGAFNFQVRVNNVIYNSYSDEFYELTLKKPEREYIVKNGFLHDYCFVSFCNYIEIISFGLSIEEARKKLTEYEFLLLTVISSNNQEFKESYILYWREILLRVIYILQNGEHSFYYRFNETQRAEIINDLTRIENSLR